MTNLEALGVTAQLRLSLERAPDHTRDAFGRLRL